MKPGSEGVGLVGPAMAGEGAGRVWSGDGIWEGKKGGREQTTWVTVGQTKAVWVRPLVPFRLLCLLVPEL